MVLIGLLYFRDEFYAEGDPAHPVAGLVGLRRPGRGGRRHRPVLHPAGPGAAGGLLARPAGAGGHYRPGRGVRTGSVVPEARGDLFAILTSALGIFTLIVTAYLFLRPAEPRARLGARGRGPGQGTAGQVRRQGLARLLRAARRQERDLVADRQGLHLLPGRVGGDAGQRRPDRRPGGVARRDRSLPGRGGAARLGAGRDGMQRARRGGVVPRGRPDRARARRRGDRERGRLQPGRPVRCGTSGRWSTGWPSTATSPRYAGSATSRAGNSTPSSGPTDSWRGSQTERGFSMALGRIGAPGDDECVLATATEDGVAAGGAAARPVGLPTACRST